MDYTAHRILITGGLGFIGSSLIASLKKRFADKVKISVLDNFSNGSLSQLAKALNCDVPTGGSPVSILGDVVVHRGDVTVKKDISALVEEVDTIVHLAAQTSVPLSTQDPIQDFEQNVVGMFNVLNAARTAVKKPRIVFSSSNAAIGEVEQPVNELSLPNPISPYGASKLTSETYLRVFSQSYGMDNIALRFGNVYGPGSLSNTGVVTRFIKQAIDGEVLEIYGDGSQTRDFIYVDDLVRSIERAIFLDNTNFELFQISSGLETKISKVAEQVCDEVVRAGIRRPDIEFNEKRSGDIVRNVSDVFKAKEKLNWQTEISIEDGIASTVKWYLDQPD